MTPQNKPVNPLPFLKNHNKNGKGARRPADQEPDQRHLLLRPRCERPCHRRATEQLHEVAPFHRFTPKPMTTDNYSRVSAVHCSKRGPSMTASGQKRRSNTSDESAGCPLHLQWRPHWCIGTN